MLECIDHVQLAMPPGGEDAARPFYVDYDRFVEQLTARGVTVRLDDLPFDGKQHCYIDDPFGNRLELIDL